MSFRKLFLVALLAFGATRSQAYEVVYEGRSAYHQVRVTQENGFRYLAFDRTRGTQSAMKLLDPTFLYYTYTQMAFAGLAFNPQPQDVLFLGLGGASMPKFFRQNYPDANIDIAEIDPMVIDVAQKYFNLIVDPRMRIHKTDGRVFLRKTEKKYDMIVLDAYDTRSIPFHLTTKEFLEIARKALKPEGLIVSNIWSPELNDYFEAEIKTFQSTFPELYVFHPGADSGNYIFIVTNQKGEVDKRTLEERARQLGREKKFHFDLAYLIHERFEYATNRPTKGQLLTDSYAPVDRLRKRQSD